MHIFFAFNVRHTSRYFGLIVTRELFLVLSPPFCCVHCSKIHEQKTKKEAKQETLKRHAESKNKKEKNAFDNASDKGQLHSKRRPHREQMIYKWMRFEDVSVSATRRSL